MDYPSNHEIEKATQHLTHLKYEQFVHHDLWSPQWWFLVACAILPWILWWLLIDQTRIKQIWLFGAILGILIVQLDDFGAALNLWNYPYQIFYFTPRLNGIDLSVLPVLHMLVYQYFTKWKPFVIVNIIMALIFAYIAEPFFVKIDVYKLVHWKYIYSVPIYVLKAVVVKFLIEKVLALKKEV